MKSKKAAVLKDSGSRRNFETGAVRDTQKNKGRFDLVPEEALLMFALIFEWGAEKYEARNWENGMPIAQYLDSGIRHALKYKAGLRDQPHLSQALWNIACALQTAIWIERGLLPVTLFDLPNHVGKKKVRPLSEIERKSLWGEQ